MTWVGKYGAQQATVVGSAKGKTKISATSRFAWAPLAVLSAGMLA